MITYCQIEKKFLLFDKIIQLVPARATCPPYHTIDPGQKIPAEKENGNQESSELNCPHRVLR